MGGRAWIGARARVEGVAGDRGEGRRVEIRVCDAGTRGGERGDAKGDSGGSMVERARAPGRLTDGLKRTQAGTRIRFCSAMG